MRWLHVVQEEKPLLNYPKKYDIFDLMSVHTVAYNVFYHRRNSLTASKLDLFAEPCCFCCKLLYETLLLGLDHVIQGIMCKSLLRLGNNIKRAVC